MVTFHYTLKDKDGNVLDKSVGGDPLAYLHGHSNIIPGLEVHMESKKVGDKLQVHVTPEKGYGSYDPDKRFLIARDQLPGDIELEPGMALELHAEDGETWWRPLWLSTSVPWKSTLTRPMAGIDLYFEVEVMSIRDASAEEIQHGHVHGPGGHHH